MISNFFCSSNFEEHALTVLLAASLVAKRWTQNVVVVTERRRTHAYLHGEDARRHLRGAEAAQEVVEHLAGGLLVRLGPQQQVLQAAQELTLLLLPLWVEMRKQHGRQEDFYCDGETSTQ